METNLMLTAIKQPERTNCLTVSKLLPEENKIIELKYSAPVFGKMQPAELINQASVLLIKIHVITGWEVPQKELMDIFIDQFAKKMIESYPNINSEEIEYAFRNKPVEIKEWGKAMNISIIDEVLQPYLNKRFELSKFEEHKSIEYKPDIEKIEREYQEFLKTPLGKKLKPNISFMDDERP